MVAHGPKRFLGITRTYTTEEGQYGYNGCDGMDGQSSLCQTVHMNNLNDFCLWGPPIPGKTIGDTERYEVAWCTQAGHGTRVIPAGTISSAHWVETPNYIQVTGAQVFSNGVQIAEWTSFISYNQFCFRFCKAASDAWQYCQHIYDIQGCAWNEPGDYGPGFDVPRVTPSPLLQRTQQELLPTASTSQVWEVEVWLLSLSRCARIFGGPYDRRACGFVGGTLLRLVGLLRIHIILYLHCLLLERCLFGSLVEWKLVVLRHVGRDQHDGRAPREQEQQCRPKPHCCICQGGVRWDPPNRPTSRSPACARQVCISLMPYNLTIECDGACRNNGAELTAFVIAFEEAIKIRNELRTNPHFDLTLKTDSRYCVDIFTRWIDGWKQNGFMNSKRLPVANRDLIEQIDGLWDNMHNGGGGTVHFVWIPREQNEEADRLANLGCDQAMQNRAQQSQQYVYQQPQYQSPPQHFTGYAQSYDSDSDDYY
ncbi:hypothetical protein RQP46_006944 [Phenoliferia psychrophenolica]